MPLENINNSLVADNELILPAQAFVDWAHLLLNTGSTNADTLVNFATLGIVHFATSSQFLVMALNAALDGVGGTFTIHFNDNALDSDSIAAILGICVDWSAENPTTCTLDISGGTNAAPVTTGGSDYDKLINLRGWTVPHN